MAQRLILASGSPRRRALLGELSVPFRVVASDAAETLDPRLDAEAQAVALAECKANAVAARQPSGLVLGADTIVALSGHILGKPHDDQDAGRMLRALSGREHRVLTGLALADAATEWRQSAAVVSQVCFRTLSDEEIAAYVASGELRDKAGAYAIQGLGAALIAGFDGCYTSIVGLPLCETARLLAEAGLPVAAAPPVCRLPDGAPCPRLV